MKRILAVSALLLAMASTLRAQEAYAVLTEENNTLTYYYDNDKDSRPGTVVKEQIGTLKWGCEMALIKNKVKLVVFDKSFDNARLGSTSWMFACLGKLEDIVNLQYLNTDAVTDMSFMFYDCSSLKTLDLKGFNTRNVTNMDRMFEGCNNLVTIYVANDWKPEKGFKMFSECYKLVGGNGTTYSQDHMDAEYARIGEPGAPGYFTDCAAILSYCIYTSNNNTLTFYYDEFYDTREKMGQLFYGVIGNSDGWLVVNKDVKRVVFTESFSGARPQCTDYWFNNFSSLEIITGIENLNTSHVSSMYFMFAGCGKLKELDLSHFETRMVDKWTGMFKDCSSLERIYVAEGCVWSTASGSMFPGCEKLTGGNGTHYAESHTRGDYARVDKPGAPGYFTSTSAGAPTSISLDHTAYIFVNPNYPPVYLTATVSQESAGHVRITWSSSDPSVATVDSQGLVTPIGPGRATIIASASNGQSAKCKVTVNEHQKVNPRTISFTQPVFYLYEGESLKLDYEMEPKYATEFTFTSTSPGVVEVSANGTVKGVRAGVCRVAVQWTDPDGLPQSAVCRVEVSAR